MDMNQLLYNHQAALIEAESADTAESRDASDDRVGQHGARITAYRRDNNLSETGWPKDERVEERPASGDDT